MNKPLTWLFGMALGVMAMGNAATDSTAAEPGAPAVATVDYVRVCDAYGTGFFYIPGTETCLRVGGYVRFDATAAEPAFWDEDLPGFLRLVPARSYNYYSTLSRVRVELDARTNTELGLFRSFIQVQQTIGVLPSVGGATGDFVPAFFGGLFPQFGSPSVNVTELRSAFIQFGGLMAGRAFSFYNLPYFSTFSSPLTEDGFVNLLAYTFTAGKLSASISIEDGTFHRTNYRTARFDAVNNVVILDGYGGHTLPDVVGAITYDDTWGSLKLAGALHHVRLADPAFDDELGYAVQFGGEIFLPTSAAPGLRDRLYGGVVYTHGATDYSGLASDEDRFGTAAGFAVFDGQGYRDIAIILGGVPAPISLQSKMLATVWGGHVGLQHYWSPTLQSSVSASVLRASDAFFIPGDFTQTRVAANLVWSPAPQMRVGFELVYDRTDFDGNITDPFKALAGLPVVSSFDKFQGVLRVQRSF